MGERAAAEPEAAHPGAQAGPRSDGAVTVPGGRSTASSATWTWAAAAGWAGLTAYLLWQALAGPLLEWSDSAVYQSMARRPWWSAGLWAGPRPPFLPLLLKLVGHGTAFAVVQALIAAAAWGVLAWSTGRVLPRGWRRLTGTWLVLGFATVTPVVLWNRSVLSESLSMSTLALLVAALLWVVRGATWPRVAAVVGAAAVFATERDAQVATVALLAGGLALVLAWRVLTRSGSSRGTARLAVLVAGMVTVTAAAAWGTVAGDRAVQGTQDVFYVRVFPDPARVAWFAAHGMPQAAAVDAAARTAPPPAAGTARTVFVPLTSPAFRPLRRWMDTRASHAYALWLVTHPGYDLTEPLLRPERAFDFADGNLDFYAATTHRDPSPLTPVLWPSLVPWAAVALVGTWLGVFSGRWRTRTWRLAVALMAIGGIAALVAWHGDGQETTRHTVEALAQIRLAAWLAAVFGGLRHTGERTPGPERAGAGAE